MCQENDTEPIRDRDASEKKQKLAAYLQEAQMAAGFGITGRPPLQARVEAQINRAQHEAYNVERLHELQHLLAKNPDVARILDLLDSVQLR